MYAVTFVPTRRVPHVPAITSQVRLGVLGGLPARARITLTIDPWVAPERVLEVYREVRSDLYEKAPRQPTDETLALARFIYEHTIENPEHSYPERWPRWRDRRPESTIQRGYFALMAERALETVWPTVRL